MASCGPDPARQGCEMTGEDCWNLRNIILNVLFSTCLFYITYYESGCLSLRSPSFYVIGLSTLSLEGKNIAEIYCSSYMDVSAILNHRVDDLLVEMLKLLRVSRLRMTRETDRRRQRPRSRDDSCLMGCLSKASRGALLRPFVQQRSHSSSSGRQSKSCENLLRIWPILLLRYLRISSSYCGLLPLHTKALYEFTRLYLLTFF